MGSGVRTKPLPPKGQGPQKITNEALTLTPAETEYVYNCINQQKLVECIKPKCPETFYSHQSSPQVHNQNQYKVVRKSPAQRKKAFNNQLGNPVQFSVKQQKKQVEPPKVKSLFSFIGELNQEPTSSPDDPLNWSIFSTHPVFPTQGYQQKSIYYAVKANKAPCTNGTQKPLDPELNCEYLDSFDDVQPQLTHSKQFRDGEHISTTYLGKITGVPSDKEENFGVRPNSTVPIKIMGKLPGMALLDTGATGSYMPMEYFMKQPELQKLPKLTSQIKELTVGNGATLKIHFAICITVTVNDLYRFEIYTCVADIAPTVDLVIGIKNMAELEGDYLLRNMTFKFKNRSPFIKAKKTVIVPPGKEGSIEAYFTFPKPITGTCVVKLFQGSEVVTFQVPVVNNTMTIGCTNTTKEEFVYRAEAVLGIADLRSMGYYMLLGSAITDSIARHHMFEDAEHLCEQYNGMVKSDKTKFSFDKGDPFPWLATDDWRRTATDHEILEKQIDLSKSHMSPKEKVKIMEICKENIKAFSLRDEIGECPNIKIHIDLHDKTPFFVRPFSVAEDDKPWTDWQMERLVHLGILTKNSTTHTSPVMLLSRKLTTDKRIVVDFRQLNSRVLKRNTTTPLMRDILTTLGRSKVEILSVLDFKDAYHSLRLDDESKEYCGIVPYFGAPCYRYERMPQGLSISPAMWIEYLNVLLNNIKHRECYIGIMDDLLIFGRRKIHMSLIEDLLSQTIKHGLKISPRKCQFFVKEMVYMGNLFTIKGDHMTLTPLKSRCEAIQNIPTPKTPKDCKSFCGMVNYLSIFCPKLQEILQPIYELTKKGKVFKWTSAQEEAFTKTKGLLSSSPVLCLPARHGRFTLYTDTSRTHAGSALWQMQGGKQRLLGYASKSLPEAAQNYSVTELEMKGMLTGMMTWSYIIGRREFDCAIDHQAVVYILKAKTEPPTKRIMRLLEALSAFNFRLYYIKGKDLILADYLSRANIPDSEDPTQLIPITISDRTKVDDFSVYNCLQAQYSALTRKQAKEAGISLPPVHGVGKALDPHKQPEAPPPPPQQAPVAQRQPPPAPPDPQNQGDGVGLPDLDPPPPPDYDQLPIRPRGNTDMREIDRELWNDDFGRRGHIPRNPGRITEGPVPPPGPHPMIDTDGPILDVDVTYRRPMSHEFIIPPSLLENVDLTKVVSKHLPKQHQLDKVLKQIQLKLLRDTHLPIELKDIEKHYMTSPHFKDMYCYLNTGKLPKNPDKAETVLCEARFFMLIDKLLFIVATNKQKELFTRLCVPTSMVDRLLYWYHTATVGGHMGINKCYITLTERFACPGLTRHVRAYIISCHLCQILRPRRITPGTLQYRVNINTDPLTHFSMDIKHMIPGKGGYKYILVMYCELSNFLIADRLRTLRSDEICFKILRGCIGYFGVPTLIVCDQDPAFLSSLSQWMMQMMKIKMVTCGPTNHKSLKAEAGIKSIASLLKVHLCDFGDSWPLFVPVAMMTHNHYNTPNLDGLSPMHIAFGRKGDILPHLEPKVDIVVSPSFRAAYEKLVKVLGYMRERVEKFRINRAQVHNKDKEPRPLAQGDIVYMVYSGGSTLQTASRKMSTELVGPYVVYQVISQGQYIVMSLDGYIVPHIMEESRLIPGYVQTKTGNVDTLAELQCALRDPDFKAKPMPPAA